jgi:transcriptional regulator with AAA-type ATPase domain/NAD-dependent dihydropyrimidine dehydrogenase PreA subunit
MVASEEAEQLMPLGYDCDNALNVDTGDCQDWLSFHRVWGQLSDDALRAIAHHIIAFKTETNARIYEQDQSPLGFYLLKWGAIELYRRSPIGRSHVLYRNAGQGFGYVPLLQSQTSQVTRAVYQTSAIALSPCEIWFIHQADFKELAQSYPDIQIVMSQLLSQDVAQFAERIAWEQTRIQGLQDYLHPVPHGQQIIGESKASQKLRQQIETAATDIQPICIQGPRGSGKTFVAGLIHAASGLSDRPFAELDCAQLPRLDGNVDTSALFGIEGGRFGILELLERGTLLLNNTHLLPRTERDRLFNYLESGIFTRNPSVSLLGSSSNHLPSATAQAWVRLIVASPQKLSLPVPHHTLKLFSLSQRKADIPDLAEHFLTRFSQAQGRDRIQLDQADRRRLISYAYPGNVSELANILSRAVVMTPPGQTLVPEQVLWSVQSDKNSFRIDLLEQIGWLRQFLLSDWWPKRIWWIMMAIFVPVTIAGYLGPQTRESSITLNLFWAWWWPMYLALFAFVGRVWCAVCPFMIAGEWLRSLSLWLWPRDLLPWPTKWLNRWGAWVLFAGFLVIYLWEKLWDLPHTPYLSSWLLVAIAAGAVICSIIYERRLWCRYLCPIGGMNGMFAKLSMVELRSSQQVCGSQCQTFGCYKGSDATPVLFDDALPNEGQATEGCPLYSHPAQLQDNRDCVLCMTCLKACPHRSVQLNLRFPATDLIEEHQGFWAEAALLLLLLGGVFMHHSYQLLALVGWQDIPVDAAHLGVGLPIVAILLSIPAILIVLTHAIARGIDPKQPSTLAIIYAYMPLTLAANLTHYIPAAMTEAGQLLPVLARSLGWSGDRWPTVVWSMDVVAFLQGITLLSAIAFSFYPLVRISQRPLWSNLPHVVLMISFIAAFFWLMV